MKNRLSHECQSASGRQLEGKSSGELDVAGAIYRKLRHTEEGIIWLIETAVTVSWRCEDMPVKSVQEFTFNGEVIPLGEAEEFNQADVLVVIAEWTRFPCSPR